MFSVSGRNVKLMFNEFLARLKIGQFFFKNHFTKFLLCVIVVSIGH